MRAAGDLIESYYFTFDATGVEEIDAILAAVASAGKSYHNTEGWSDDEYGISAAEVIQRAADRAAQVVRG